MLCVKPRTNGRGNRILSFLRSNSSSLRLAIFNLIMIYIITCMFMFKKNNLQCLYLLRQTFSTNPLLLFTFVTKKRAKNNYSSLFSGNPATTEFATGLRRLVVVLVASVMLASSSIAPSSRQQTICLRLFQPLRWPCRMVPPSENNQFGSSSP